MRAGHAEAGLSAVGGRVLIVEDELRLREMLHRSATEMGFACCAAASAEQALRFLSTQELDILLLDLNLPGMGGLELLEHCRRRWPQVQAIILTGFGNLEAAKRAIRLDASDFLTKPCRLEELEIALARAQSRRRQLLSAEELRPREEAGSESVADRPLTLEELEKRHILAALDRNGGNRAATAAELGISERTLYYRLGRYQRSGSLAEDQ
jgi:two-component system NtrC family response regulator/two-component system response regulator AtoC